MGACCSHFHPRRVLGGGWTDLWMGVHACRLSRLGRMQSLRCWSCCRLTRQSLASTRTPTLSAARSAAPCCNGYFPGCSICQSNLVLAGMPYVSSLFALDGACRPCSPKSKKFKGVPHRLPWLLQAASSVSWHLPAGLEAFPHLLPQAGCEAEAVLFQEALLLVTARLIKWSQWVPTPLSIVHLAGGMDMRPMHDEPLVWL